MNHEQHLSKVQAAAQAGKLYWRAHALERMLERNITREEVVGSLFHGEVIEEYPSSKPFPAILVQGSQCGRVIHVVVAYDSTLNRAYIISTYEPDKDHFEADFRSRRRKK